MRLVVVDLQHAARDVVAMLVLTGKDGQHVIELRSRLALPEPEQDLHVVG